MTTPIFLEYTVLVKTAPLNGNLGKDLMALLLWILRTMDNKRKKSNTLCGKKCMLFKTRVLNIKFFIHIIDRTVCFLGLAISGYTHNKFSFA